MLELIKRNIWLAIMCTALLAIGTNAFSQLSFVEAIKDFPRVEKNLRKWDAPVVADLDQDGFPDLILNEHGLGVSIYWNNDGKFAKPYDLIMGDLHGVTVGDFDMDGQLEIAISRGGGSGSNARNSKIYRVTKDRQFTVVPDFETPLALMRGRTVKFLDGDNDGDLDLLNFAFPDKDMNGESENYIYRNNGNGQLNISSSIPPINQNGQKTLTTDFDNDGTIDLVMYGDGPIKFFRGNGDLTYSEVTKKLISNDIEQVSSIVEFDYDNDGDFDLFLTRGNEFEIGETFYDAETKVWGFFTKRGPYKFEDLKVGDILQIKNFQSQWPDNDAFFIGETGYPYEFLGETHSGKDIRLVNSDALGYPDNPSEKGTYIGYVGNDSWRISGNLWAPGTGIVLGVSAYPKFDHPNGLNDVLLENNKGKFKEVTKEAGLFYEEHTTSASIADLDNNGYNDLVIIRRGDLIHENISLVYLNQGMGIFKKSQAHGIVSEELGAIGMGAEPIDYNLDGKVDMVIGNERGKWHLFKNKSTSNNNYITIEIGASPSGKATALGAEVRLESCDTKQVKRVGSSGANYSLSFNPFVHFGLGNCLEPVKLKITWSNGEIEERTVTTLNETFKLND